MCFEQFPLAPCSYQTATAVTSKRNTAKFLKHPFCYSSGFPVRWFYCGGLSGRSSIGPRISARLESLSMSFFWHTIKQCRVPIRCADFMPPSRPWRVRRFLSLVVFEIFCAMIWNDVSVKFRCVSFSRGYSLTLISVVVFEFAVHKSPHCYLVT